MRADRAEQLQRARARRAALRGQLAAIARADGDLGVNLGGRIRDAEGVARVDARGGGGENARETLDQYRQRVEVTAARARRRRRRARRARRWSDEPRGCHVAPYRREEVGDGGVEADRVRIGEEEQVRRVKERHLPRM